MKRIQWAGHRLVSLYREGRPGSAPADQLVEIVTALDSDLRDAGLSLENAVRHRLWTRDRTSRDGTNEVRARLITDRRRCATSSFIDAARFVSAADVAVELLAQYPKVEEEHRRLVDFDPPRRYARYLVQDGLMFTSGMAEPGDSLEEQFANAMAEITRSMRRELVAWRDVLSAQLFIERGHGKPAWLMDRVRQAAGGDLPYIDCEEVDGLASLDKHLEIEITAALSR